MTDEAQLEKGIQLAKALQKARNDSNGEAILKVLNKLKDFTMSISILKKTDLGLKLHELRKDYPLASEIRNRWMEDFKSASKAPPKTSKAPSNDVDPTRKRMRDEVEQKQKSQEDHKRQRKEKLEREARKLAESMTESERDAITGRQFMHKLEKRLGKSEGYFEKEKAFIKDIGAVALQQAQVSSKSRA